MPTKSAGILLYKHEKGLKIFLVHPGGPFHKNRDLGAWSIPKGEFDDTEKPLEAALREFEEETGTELSKELKYLELSPVVQKGGKVVHAFACESDIDAKSIVSNTFDMEWPPKSGKFIKLPEIDRGEWFDDENAKTKINPAQAAFIDELKLILQNK